MHKRLSHCHPRRRQWLRGIHDCKGLMAQFRHETCPISTGGGTRRVHLVREGGGPGALMELEERAAVGFGARGGARGMLSRSFVRAVRMAGAGAPEATCNTAARYMRCLHCTLNSSLHCTHLRSLNEGAGALRKIPPFHARQKTVPENRDEPPKTPPEHALHLVCVERSDLLLSCCPAS